MGSEIVSSSDGNWVWIGYVDSGSLTFSNPRGCTLSCSGGNLYIHTANADQETIAIIADLNSNNPAS